MDVLIIEGNELVRSVLAETLDAGDISATGASDEEALMLPSNDASQIVITGINRGHDEDLTGLQVVAALRRKWPQLCAVYLAASRRAVAGAPAPRNAGCRRALSHETCAPNAVDAHSARAAGVRPLSGQSLTGASRRG
jgi:CheY-like chemotaxis protein